MNILEDLKKGKCGIYATYVALLSVLLLFIFASTGFTSHALFWIFSIIGWAEAALILMIEFPFCAKLFRGTDRILQVANNKTFKGITYAVFATLLWLSLLTTTQPIIVAAITVSLSSLLNLASVYRREGDEGNSSIQDGRAWAGAAAQAATRV